MKNILVVAAENSAESYGVQVVEEFRKGTPNVTFFGLGGDRSIEKGVDVIVHNRELAVVGIIEVISSIFKLKRVMSLLVSQAIKRKAAAALLVDYPDFNLRLAKKLKKAGIPVYYYISPTVWAWRYSRVKLIKKVVDHIFIIFPFEIEIYKKENIPFTYTGHPLLPMIKVDEKREDFRKQLNLADKELAVTLMPGSRPGEVAFLLPEMLKAMKELKKEFNIRLFLIKAGGIDREQITGYLNQSHMQVEILEQTQGHNLINASDFVLTTCGTSNMEIAVIGVPFVAVYRLSGLSYILGIKLVKINNYSMVNILAGRKIVPELIQKNFTAANIVREAGDLLRNRGKREEMLRHFHKIREQLSQSQNPPAIIHKKISGDILNDSKGEVTHE